MVQTKVLLNAIEPLTVAVMLSINFLSPLFQFPQWVANATLWQCVEAGNKGDKRLSYDI
jgi:hypothetical protein